MVVNLGSVRWALLLFKHFRSPPDLSHSCCRWPESKTIVRSKEMYTKQMFVLVRMQLRNHVNTWAVKRFKRYRGYAVYIRYQIWTVASAREWDFISQVVCWHCAFAHRRGNTVCGSRDPYIENRFHRALNVNSSPMNSSHSKIISNE